MMMGGGMEQGGAHHCPQVGNGTDIEEKPGVPGEKLASIKT